MNKIKDRDDNDNRYEDNNKAMYKKHVKDILLNKPSCELLNKQKN